MDSCLTSEVGRLKTDQIDLDRGFLPHLGQYDVSMLLNDLSNDYEANLNHEER
jgi:hypothetical protein